MSNVTHEENEVAQLVNKETRVKKEKNVYSVSDLPFKYPFFISEATFRLVFFKLVALKTSVSILFHNFKLVYKFLLTKYDVDYAFALIASKYE